MYSVTKSIDIDFGHSVRGHTGLCVGIHGHLWRFELEVSTEELDKQGFVLDFKDLKKKVLTPVFNLLDHAYAIGADTWQDIGEPLSEVGRRLVGSRSAVHGTRWYSEPMDSGPMVHGAGYVPCGGIRVVVFPFSPTAERLSKWLYDFAEEQLKGFTVVESRIYETLHPVETLASYKK
jgi:6-pyruvoyl-tetrahydropterin synthase